MSQRLKWTKVAPRHWKSSVERWRYELSNEGTLSAPLFRWRATYIPSPSGTPVVFEGEARTMARAAADASAQKQPTLFGDAASA